MPDGHLIPESQRLTVRHRFPRLNLHVYSRHASKAHSLWSLAMGKSQVAKEILGQGLAHNFFADSSGSTGYRPRLITVVSIPGYGLPHTCEVEY